MLGDNVLDNNITLGGSSGYHVGAGLDLVGDNAVGDAFQVVHASDLDNISSGASDIRTHRVKEVRKVNYVRLLGSIFNDGIPLCQVKVDL